ncbi:MAG TPA: UPF0280 family protein [Dongiaceae bacterium]|jgi:ApbE superfamily uncharacterized protein (UPF0280 family)|nr:UPF0280 family protein [Dongiaceae bacterium]
MARARAARLSGNRLHLQDGPIDLVIEAMGAASEVEAGYAAAARRFQTILDELCAELPILRLPIRPGNPMPEGVAARRMWHAAAPFAGAFITPMAAVAGAVAEEVLGAMTAAADIRRAYVNNGGDIALYLASGEQTHIGLVDRPDRPRIYGTVSIAASQPVRGVATSGWRGRSFSLGIADAVTVLAATAAGADAAATVIANAVDLPGHPAIRRQPARDRDPQSDLGAIPVTVAVGALTDGEVEAALASGLAAARDCIAEGLVAAAALHLAGRTVQTGLPLLHHAKAA